MAYFGRLLEEEVAALFQPKLQFIKILIHNARCSRYEVREKSPNTRICGGAKGGGMSKEVFWSPE